DVAALRRSSFTEQTLPTQPAHPPIVNFIDWNIARLNDEIPAIVPGLQQPGNQIELEVADHGGFTFAVHQGTQLLRQACAELLVIANSVLRQGQREQALAFLAFDATRCDERRDVALRAATLACQQ